MSLVETNSNISIFPAEILSLLIIQMIFPVRFKWNSPFFHKYVIFIKPPSRFEPFKSEGHQDLLIKQEL